MIKSAITRCQPSAALGCGVLLFEPAASTLKLTRPQADALARLIRIHLDAYDEAACPGDPRPETEPLNGSELDLLEPLVALLEQGK